MTITGTNKQNQTADILAHALRVPNRLTAHRRGLGYTQREYAAMHGMSVKRVGAWEQNAFTDRDLDLLRLTIVQGYPPVGIFPELVAALRQDVATRKATFFEDPTLPVPTVTLPPVVLGINPGGRFVHWAIFVGLEPRNWGLVDLNQRADRSSVGLAHRLRTALRPLLVTTAPDAVYLAGVPSEPMFERAAHVEAEITILATTFGHEPTIVLRKTARAEIAGDTPTTHIALARLLTRQYPRLSHDLKLVPPPIPDRASTLAPQAKGLVDALCAGLVGARRLDASRTPTLPLP